MFLYIFTTGCVTLKHVIPTMIARCIVAGAFIAVIALYALVATGKLDGMKQKLARGASELTGGAAGKKPDDEDK